MKAQYVRRDPARLKADRAMLRAAECQRRAWRLMAGGILEGARLRAVVRLRLIASWYEEQEAFYRGAD